jgi:hypothetical protein
MGKNIPDSAGMQCKGYEMLSGMSTDIHQIRKEYNSAVIPYVDARWYEVP